MSDQPVTPDREALVRLVQRRLPGSSQRSEDANRQWAAHMVHDFLPLLTDALDRARQQGRDDAAHAIETAIVRRPVDSDETVTARTMRQIHAEWDMEAARLARGADRKAADAPWDTALDVDPFTGQPDQHEHGDSCDAEECCE